MAFALTDNASERANGACRKRRRRRGPDDPRKSGTAAGRAAYLTCPMGVLSATRRRAGQAAPGGDILPGLRLSVTAQRPCQ